METDPPKGFELFGNPNMLFAEDTGAAFVCTLGSNGGISGLGVVFGFCNAN